MNFMRRKSYCTGMSNLILIMIITIRFSDGWIVPGTLWCGPGNISTGNYNLGILKGVDACCRDHDLCEDYIPGYGTKNNLRNPSRFTRLNCNCDDTFWSCLHAVKGIINGIKAATIGSIYFNALNRQCFRKDYPIVSCIKQQFGRCLQYRMDVSRKRIYQWFDLQHFYLS
ncbi:phospholipase A2-like [Chrysoperla carnea]|uniref:phospholipase A2-like n=1 Tax=Chrysoperla carnea TaxID=189513 RepID=UPI001D08EC08|nr:phospholipase A2-like [Chrysoperla carnea]